MGLVHAEVMAHLVKHGFPDLLQQRLAVGRLILQVPLEEEDAVGETPVSALNRVSLIETQDVVLDPSVQKKLPAGHVLDGNLYVLQVASELTGKRPQGLFDQVLELRSLHAVGKKVIGRTELRGASKGAVRLRQLIQLGVDEAQGVVAVGGIGFSLERVFGGSLSVAEARPVQEPRDAVWNLLARKAHVLLRVLLPEVYALTLSVSGAVLREVCCEVPYLARTHDMELEKADSPVEAGFSETRLPAALRILDDAVLGQAFPGGIAVVGRGGKLAGERPFGGLDYRQDAPRVSADTIYDVASLTKVVVTTTLAMILYEKGELRLDAPVRDYLAEFAGEGKDRVTVADLLSHSSGILWWKDYYRSLGGNRPFAEVKARYVREIACLPLDYPPRTKSVYSDLGFILLGEILERVAPGRLDELARVHIFEPLGMEHTSFNPPSSLRPKIAPTEDDPWRGHVLVGEVHDENAFALGGVAPHAGLFSTAGDLAVFAQTMLNGGVYGKRRVVQRSTVELFTRRVDSIPESSRALGWDTPSRDSSAGRYFSPSSFGHTGFTGTSLWIDPVQHLFIVLLTNRVYPSRDNVGIRGVRTAFHDAVMEALLEVPQPRAR